MLQTVHYKLLSLLSFIVFLYSILEPISMMLLLLTGVFGYLYLSKLMGEIMKGNFIGLLPKRWKKYLQEGKLVEYVSGLEIVKKTPILGYMLPLLRFNNNQQQQKKQVSQRTSFINQQTSLLPSILSQHQPNNRTKILQQLLQLDDNKIRQNNPIQKHKQIYIQKKQQQPATFTTCQSISYKDNMNNKRVNSSGAILSGRKSSLMLMKRKFAQEETSSTDQRAMMGNDKIELNSNHNKSRLHRSISQNKLNVHKQSQQLTGKKVDIEDKPNFTQTNNKPSSIISQPHPLKTIQQYLQALIWMMKRLLGLRKMTSRLKRTSMVKLTIVTCVLWVGIVLQIKTDSRKGKLLFRTLRALMGVLSVFAALGVTCMLGWKVHRRLTQGQEPQRKQPQFLLYQRK